MTPEQLNWTDKQWAIHLNCPVQEIPSIRAYVHANFFPVIAQDKDTKAYNFIMTKMGTSMAGTRRVMPMISDKNVFSDFESARTHANNEVIPKLELTKFWSDALYIPQRALQMLHIGGR
ncbi:MAG: hypothetical protein J6J82_02465 [Alphaproteobacteria bacterium]|nr:hypothetical protein [Alphaproteobacteria bacterium]